MRASKNVESQRSKAKKQKIKSDEIHISGAEGIYAGQEISTIAKQYIKRASEHTRGIPDRVVITIEKLQERPEMIKSLPVITLKSVSPLESGRFIRQVLKKIGISDDAIRVAFNLLKSKKTMRGASLLLAESGRRIEPDKERGVRVTRLGISKVAEKTLSGRLAKQGINNARVKEALVLASKVASCKQVMAELCISDNPDYTTGYIASKNLGYIRVPHIKNKGDRRGGRIFFLQKSFGIDEAVTYLEHKPVIINGIAECKGIFSSDEIIHNYNM